MCAATTCSRAAPRRPAAVAFHRRARGYAREETFAVGDSREDLACAAQVDIFWLVANAIARDPSIREALAQHENVRVTEAGHGAGVYEAVVQHVDGRVSASYSSRVRRPIGRRCEL